MSLGYTFDGDNSIRMRVNGICNEIDRLANRLANYQRHANDLESAGLCYASVYWMRKDDPSGLPDQMELTHSTNSDYYRQNGTRREYIGVDAAKQRKVLDAIERTEAFEAAKAEIDRLQAKISEAERFITRLEYRLLAKQENLDIWTQNAPVARLFVRFGTKSNELP